ncbi:uncharacterized protein ARMOST_09651 [Armillaria ostoyae]|uniref:Uncharacterized protein n=1 Tax=Armillaria ostoyae TaxID=47428 RepID=A0A284RC59_ARMOS|nr:uncharacterized protein ARMOST_09651 [Armillaria ostoyae]
MLSCLLYNEQEGLYLCIFRYNITDHTSEVATKFNVAIIRAWPKARQFQVLSFWYLALLSICCAGWSTLSQSWLLAGQA